MKREGRGTYSMFLGVMTKHHRVQIVPVATRARFWVKESFSAGRARSEMPAMTRDHWKNIRMDVHAGNKHAVNELVSYLHNRSPIQFSLASTHPS